jgi:hypothetical protein
MKRRPSVSRRVLALLLVLGVAFTLLPRPVSAAEGSTSPAPASPIAASVLKAARTVALTAPARAPQVAEQQQQKPGDELAGSSAFFTRPLGIAVLAILAAGTGYAVYSTSHDRIHSEARQGQ